MHPTLPLDRIWSRAPRSLDDYMAERDAYRNHHRRPPLPTSMTRNEWGRCRWCDQPIVGEDGEINKRRLWHPECSFQAGIAFTPQHAYRRLVERDGERCARCGATRAVFEVDHITALALAPRHLWYWSIHNLQLLCTECHRLKTVADVRRIKRLRERCCAIEPRDADRQLDLLEAS